jgi:hypothetical protein
LEDEVSCGDVFDLVTRAPLNDTEDAGNEVPDAGIPHDAAIPLGDAAAASTTLPDRAAPHDAGSRLAIDATPRRLTTLLGASEAGAIDAGAQSPAVIAVEVPALRMLPFAAFSAQSLEAERSSLLVASGCVGGYATPPSGVCSTNQQPGNSSLLPVFVHLSRLTRYDVLGLQFLNASVLDVATLRSDPSASPDSAGLYFTLASEVQLGQIAPPRLSTGVALESVGAPLADVALVIDVPGGAEPVFTSDWQSALDEAESEALRNGSGWSFVLVGSPVGDDRQFNSLQLLLLPNDPASIHSIE